MKKILQWVASKIAPQISNGYLVVYFKTADGKSTGNGRIVGVDDAGLNEYLRERANTLLDQNLENIKKSTR